MTTEIIIAISIVCFTVVFVAIILANQNRDNAARDRDYGLAKLFEARASLLHIEELERRSVLNGKNEEISRVREWQREQSRERAVADAREENRS